MLCFPIKHPKSFLKGLRYFPSITTSSSVNMYYLLVSLRWHYSQYYRVIPQALFPELLLNMCFILTHTCCWTTETGACICSLTSVLQETGSSSSVVVNGHISDDFITTTFVSLQGFFWKNHYLILAAYSLWLSYIKPEASLEDIHWETEAGVD